MDTPFSRFCSFVISMLIVVGLVVVLVQGVANGDNSPGYADASGNPNVVSGSLTAIGNGIGSATHSMGQSLDNGSHTVAADTSKSVHTVGYAVNTGSRSVASAVTRSTLYSAETSLKTLTATATAVSKTSDFTIAVMTKSASLTASAVVKSSNVAAVATSRGISGVAATDYGALRMAGSIAWNGESFMGHSSLTSLAFAAHGTGHLTQLVSNTNVMASVFRPTDSSKVPVIHAVAYKPVAIVKPVAKPTPPVTPPAQLAPAPPQLPVATVAAAADRSLSAAKANDLYAWGNCTWWVFIKRYEIGDPIPNSWGNATNWAYAASLDGYVVDHHPTPGSIMQISGVDYGLGHVAFVESVDPDGTWHISEMNVLGLDVVDNKAEPASAAANYRFIHDAN